MATRRICEFLDGSNARYVLVHHSPAFTAQEIAESSHIPGRFMAKAVVVRIDSVLALAVVPASCDVSLALLRQEAAADQVRLADEDEFADRFEGCQIGTAPPFGNLFGIPTYVDSSFSDEDEIAFNAGTHTDLIVMRFKDYRRIVRPTRATISLASRRRPAALV